MGQTHAIKGRIELYAETTELHQQWLKHLLTASVAVGPCEAPLAADVEAGHSQFGETSSANTLAESQHGDEVMAKMTCAF